MAPQDDKALVEVTQEDRDGAADFWQGAGHLVGGSFEYQKDYVRSVRRGYCDNHGLVQAFARHRIQSQAADKARIEALEAENARLRELLKPFAALADYVDQHHPGWAHDGFTVAGFDDVWRYSDFSAARANLEAHNG